MSPADRTIDLDALLAPIPGADPAGADLRYLPLYDKIRTARRAADDKQQGRSAHSDADDNLSQEERAVAARDYWLIVKNLVVDALTTQSKDLQLAAWLLEADSYISGFTGADRGLELIRRLLETCWETVYPSMEDDEEPLALRVGVMESIDDRLPGILKSIALSSGSRKYSLAHYELAEKATDEQSKAELAAEGRPSTEQFVQAMSASSVPNLEALAAMIESCLGQVTALDRVTEARFAVPSAAGGPLPPSFNQIRKVLEECQFQVGRALRAKGGGTVEARSAPASRSDDDRALFRRR